MLTFYNRVFLSSTINSRTLGIPEIGLIGLLFHFMLKWVYLKQSKLFSSTWFSKLQGWVALNCQCYKAKLFLNTFSIFLGKQISILGSSFAHKLKMLESHCSEFFASLLGIRRQEFWYLAAGIPRVLDFALNDTQFLLLTLKNWNGWFLS